MRDDRGMDQVFDEVLYGLFGDAIDPRETWDIVSKMSPDASAVHVPATSQQKAERKKKIVNRVGQGLNALAMGAGTHALVMAGRDPRLAESDSKIARVASKPYKLWSKTGAHKTLARLGGEGKVNGKSAKYAVPFAVGALGLHTAELVGDSIAARALHEQSKPKKPEMTAVKKALADIVDARRRGLLTTEQAVQMSSELVEKAAGSLKLDAKKIHQHAEDLVQSPLLPGRTKRVLKPVVLAKKPEMPKPDEIPPVVPSLPEQKVAKSEDEMSITWSAEISKRDDDKRQVFGFALVTHLDGEPVIDLQGDYTPLEEIEKSAYTYVLESRKGGDMHQRDGEMPLHTADLIESFVVTPEKLEKMGLAPDAMPHGWWVGFKVNDDKQWDMVKSGERSGFSIHGSGRRVEKML